MPFSHHSHSGEFCTHAKNTLAEVLSTATSKKMHIFAFTEHVPRSNLDLYPGEAEVDDEASLTVKFSNYLSTAQALRAQLSADTSISTKLLIGFETEWIRPETGAELQLYRQLQASGDIDFFLGSVHHVHTIPIDFDRAHYERARELSGGTDALLFEAYFDSQLGMLEALHPRIVGHFDLIRLLADEKDGSMRAMGEGVWKRVVRNLEAIKAYGGLLEINSAGLRKGLKEPYPLGEICEVWKGMGGRFVMSDDSHGMEQVAACYEAVVEFMEGLGIEELSYLEKGEGGVVERRMKLEEMKKLPFWEMIKAEQEISYQRYFDGLLARLLV